MVKRSPRKRATAAAADAADKEKGVEDEEGEGEDEKSNRSEADRGAIEENPLFEEVEEKDDDNEKLNKSSSKLKRTRKPAMPNSDAVGGDAADENSEGEEESIEITAVETVLAAEDEDEPLMKKSKKQEEGNLANEADLDENIQPEKLKVVELRNELKRRDLDPRGVKTELVERLKAALKCPKNEMEVEAAGGDNNAGHESPEKGNDENSRRGSCGSELPAEAGPILEDREKTEAAIESDNTAKVQAKLNAQNENAELAESVNGAEGNTVQAESIGLRELRPQSTEVLDFEPDDEDERVKEGDAVNVECDEERANAEAQDIRHEDETAKGKVFEIKVHMKERKEEKADGEGQECQQKGENENGQRQMGTLTSQLEKGVDKHQEPDHQYVKKKGEMVVKGIINEVMSSIDNEVSKKKVNGEKGKRKGDKTETGDDEPDWLNNVASPSRSPHKEQAVADEEVIMLGDSDDDDDDIVVGDISKEDNLVNEDEENEDLDDLGDKIDAACPGGEDGKSPRKEAASKSKQSQQKKTIEGERSRSSSIEIISDSTIKERSTSAKRKKVGNDLKSGRQLREETQRLWTGSGNQADDPVEKYFSKEARDKGGFKVVVRNFARDLTKSEFYSIFVRRGEVVYCEMRKDVGFVTFKTRVAAANAVRTLNGSKTDADEGQTLSVKEVGSPPTRRASPDRRPYDARERLSSSRWGPDPLADARSKLKRPRDDRNNLFSKMTSEGGGGNNNRRGRHYSGGDGFPPMDSSFRGPGLMMGNRGGIQQGNMRNRGGEIGVWRQGQSGGSNLGGFGNEGILGERPAQYFSDYGGAYQGQGKHRGEVTHGGVADQLERQFMGDDFGGRSRRGGGGGGGRQGGGGPHRQVDDFSMREAMFEADQRMDWRRREEMEMEREASRFSDGYSNGNGYRGRGGRERRGSLDHGQYGGGPGDFYQGNMNMGFNNGGRGAGGRRGSFDQRHYGEEQEEMGFNSERNSYDGGFGVGGMMGGGNMSDRRHFGGGMGARSNLPPPHSSIGGGVRGSDGMVRSTTGIMGKAGGFGDGRMEGVKGVRMGMGGSRGGMGMGTETSMGDRMGGRDMPIGGGGRGRTIGMTGASMSRGSTFDGNVGMGTTDGWGGPRQDDMSGYGGGGGRGGLGGGLRGPTRGTWSNKAGSRRY